jgi:glycosyltransferase involved in cell wall biosynthesis
MAQSLTLSIVMPCLNEVRTLPTCIRKAQDFLVREKLNGEIIVADNGSTDGSVEAAYALGARVIAVPERGYGNALRAGIEAASGEFVIMGDSDDSYDFSALEPFLDKLKGGFDLVLGNRFAGGIRKGAMPPLHRYFGNPLLTLIGRTLYRSPSGDFYCGLRGFRRDAVRALHLSSPGMEFALEMIVKATIAKLSITEVPTTLSPDGRDRPPHLRSWRDGWRSLRFFLLLSPRGLFLYPGLALFLFGAILFSLIAMYGDVPLGPLVLSERTLVVSAAMMMIGFQSLLFWVFAKIVAMERGLLPWDGTFDRVRRWFSLEISVAVSAILVLLGIAANVRAVFVWSTFDFGPLNRGLLIGLVCAGSTSAVIGFQCLYGAFFTYLLDETSRHIISRALEYGISSRLAAGDPGAQLVKNRVEHPAEVIRESRDATIERV